MTSAPPMAITPREPGLTGFSSLPSSACDDRAPLQVSAAIMVPVGAAAMLFGLYKATTPSRREPATASIVNGTF